MFGQYFKYFIIFIGFFVLRCSRNNLLTISGSIAYDGNKGWIFMKITSDPFHPILNADCILDSFYKIGYQDSIQAYYREVSAISPHTNHTINIDAQEYLPINGKSAVPSNFSIFNLNTSISKGDSLPVSWGLVDGISPPDEWFITLSHNTVPYFSIFLPPDSESIIINGNNFRIAGTYQLNIYGIIYGSLNNAGSGSDFAGVNQRKVSIMVKE